MKRLKWLVTVIGVLMIPCLGCSQDLNFKIIFDDISGLKEGDRILWESSHIGDVKEISYNSDGNFELAVTIFPDFKDKATSATRFIIVADPGREGNKALMVVEIEKGGEPLENGTRVKGSTSWEIWEDQIKNKWNQFMEDLERLPEEAWYKKLQEEMEEFAKTLKRSGKEAREKLKKDIIPQLEKALEELKSRLKNQGREKEVEPLEEQMKEIRQI